MAVILKAAIRALDRLLRATLGVFEFCDAPHCLLRLRVARAPHPLTLPGEVVPEGALILELHLWNEHIPPMPPTGPDLAWAVQIQRQLIGSMRAVAALMVSDPRLAEVQAVGGVTVLLWPGRDIGGEKLFQHLGFTISPYHSPLGRFGEFWENLYSWWIMWAFNPATLQGRQLLRLQRVEVWMSTAALLERYATDGERRQ